MQLGAGRNSLGTVLKANHLTVEVDQDVVSVPATALDTVVPRTQVVFLADLDPTAELGIRCSMFDHKWKPRAGLAVYRDLHAAKDGVSPDRNELVSTGVAVGSPLRAALDLKPHLRINRASTRAKIAQARARFAQNQAAMLGALGRDVDPIPTCQGNVKGIVLLVDFDDEPGIVPPSEVDDYCNQVGYNGYGNNGSVRDYFYDVSDGHLTYTNFVPTAYYRANELKSWYDDPDIPCCDRARQLVQEALYDLDSQGFDFSEYDSNGDGLIDAVNVFYAGTPSSPWAYGLSPHASGVQFSADGVSTYWYQISNLPDWVFLGIFLHENGHMLCYWPDLYDYGFESYGVGKFCLMGYISSGTNPAQPCAYMKYNAGWADMTVLTSPQPDLTVPAGVNTIYKFEHPTAANEYYLIENRHQTDWDASLPDSGLAIWHVDEYGDNDWEQMTPEYHYLVTLVQADGEWDLEYKRNRGDQYDFWTSPDYPECTPDTNPNTHWWDGSASGLYVTDISTSGPTMTFDFGYGIPADIPTVSEWGVIIMALLLMTGGTVALLGRRSVEIRF